MPNLNPPGAGPFEDFATQAGDAPWMDPSEVRNLGNRRRARRHMAVGASTFVVVLMASVIAISQSGAVGQRDPEVAASPSTTPRTSATVTAPASTQSSAPSQTPSSASTPTASGTPTPTPSSAPTASPSGEDTPTDSAPGSASGSVAFGPVTAAQLPTSQLVTGANWDATTGVGWDDSLQACGSVNVVGAQNVHYRFFLNAQGSSATVYVMDFPTADQATAATRAIAASYQECTTGTLSHETEPAPLTTAPQKSPVTPVNARAHRMRPADDDYEAAVNGLIIQVGTRLMWVSVLEFYGGACSVSPSLETCPVYDNANALALLLMSP